MIHISQISNKRIDKPSDVLSVGDEVEAKITGIDFEKKRVSLSIRALLSEDVEEEEAAPVEEEPEIRELEDEVPAVEEAAEAAPAGETESAEETE